MNRPPGMMDVAREAGVSHITVSRVINGHPSVRPETRSRVEAAIRKLGYRRNSVARALKSRRSSTIGVVIVGSELYELPRILRGVETAAERAGYWVSLASRQGGSSTGDLVETLRRLTDQAVEAIAVVADRPAAVEALSGLVLDVPVAVVMSGSAPNPELSFVEVDQELGARLAVRHLLDLGHRRIAHLTGDLRTFDARARVEGWRAEIAAAGADEVVLELEGDFTAESGFRLAHRLCADGTALPTAVFAGNDQMAMGVLAAFAERGVQVPQDVSVVGFDDIKGAGYLVPALTTVRQDFGHLGSSAIELLVRMLRGERAARQKITPELVVRRSTAAPRAR
ncbi:LacI family DNA-binding transcriptional regulator [Streptomyces sp. ISL-22]|uniref:LacI family DNA-binding transcriptional regulator n=1 Tax=unclassified Streptomyces TaxID=2593676 RepID=UPI001BEB0053|nr:MULTISPECIES: LacI family DNA-binding transcriptional regulator [unclassified Streptomyces]MBT2422370.1 LacI family DNA-binding transcriptional regulator [Streptomyces sp. ISL-24]MBT2436763.1 LacI family DNA-binding transcriptional regulator [Streptomyces sp. ISL-22]